MWVPSACTAFAIGWQIGSLLSEPSLYNAAVAEKGTRAETHGPAAAGRDQTRAGSDQGWLAQARPSTSKPPAFDPIRTDALEESVQDPSGQQQLPQVLTAFDDEVAKRNSPPPTVVSERPTTSGERWPRLAMSPRTRKLFDRALGLASSISRAGSRTSPETPPPTRAAP